MLELTFSVRDPWRAPRLGASGKKMWVAFKAIFYGYLAYLLLGYVACMLAGTSLTETWRLCKLFPAAPSVEDGLIPLMVWDFGVVLAVMIVLIGSAGIAKITYRQLKGDNFYGRSDAWRYAMEHSRATVGTPLLLAVFFSALCLALWILGWVASIPTVGPVILGISAIPAFIVALLGVYIALAFLASLHFGPPVIGSTGEDALEGVIQMFSLLWTVPWRTAGYAFVTVVTSVVAAYLLVTAGLIALSLIGGVVGSVIGSTFDSIAAGAVSYLPVKYPFTSAPPEWLWPGPIATMLPAVDAFKSEPSGVLAVASFLGGVSLVVVMGVFLSFLLSCLSSGFTASYLALRRIKDGENLLEWTDEIDELEDTEPGD